VVPRRRIARSRLTQDVTGAGSVRGPEDWLRTVGPAPTPNGGHRDRSAALRQAPDHLRQHERDVGRQPRALLDVEGRQRRLVPQDGLYLCGQVDRLCFVGQVVGRSRRVGRRRVCRGESSPFYRGVCGVGGCPTSSGRASHSRFRMTASRARRYRRRVAQYAPDDAAGRLDLARVARRPAILAPNLDLDLDLDLGPGRIGAVPDQAGRARP
jgi:hypothetical protein